jgi:CxxC-x17-CxxC domain-containing protein
MDDRPRRNDRGFSSRPREMSTVKCSDCGAETQVPFKPTEGRPVYCRECYQKHRPPRRF